MLFQGNNDNVSNNNFGVSLSGIVCFLIFFSIIATLVLNYNKCRGGKRKREKLLALSLGVQRDPVVEMLFSRQEEELLQDSSFQLVAGKSRKVINSLNEDSLATAIQQKYFREAWNNYAVQITLCSGQKTLRIQPEIFYPIVTHIFKAWLRMWVNPQEVSIFSF